MKREGTEIKDEEYQKKTTSRDSKKQRHRNTSSKPENQKHISMHHRLGTQNMIKPNEMPKINTRTLHRLATS